MAAGRFFWLDTLYLNQSSFLHAGSSSAPGAGLSYYPLAELLVNDFDYRRQLVGSARRRGHYVVVFRVV